MILRGVVLLLNLIVVKTEYNASLDEDDNDISDIDVRYSLWPKYYGGETLGHILKQDSHSAKPGVLPNIEISQGQLKWASIGSGGIALLAIAYYLMIYRKKRSANDAKNPYGSIDQNQFRYGLLKSKDKREDLSMMPLTMESDEDEEQDLEVFDVRQKRTSLSINLEQLVEDIGFNDSRSGLESLLVGTEDKNSETLITTSGNGTYCQYRSMK